MKVLVAGTVLLAPLATAGLVLAAQPPGDYGAYGLTGLAAAVRSAGTVGASGGLVTLDTASAYVTGRLDSSPTSAVLADPYEPGTLVRTLAGQANAQAGSRVVVVPEATASSPGRAREELHVVPDQDVAPLHLRGGTASASAGTGNADGSATGTRLSLDGAVVADGSSSEVSLSATAASTRGRVRTRVARVEVAGGVLVLSDVVAEAAVTARGSTHTATASLTVGGATVDGQNVAVDETGVHAVGTPVVTGQTLTAATEQANAVLAAAGIEVHLARAVHRSTGTGALADTGGVLITLTTPDLPAGLAGNRLQLVVGGAVVTTHEDGSAPVLTQTGGAPPMAAPSGGAPAPGTVPAGVPAGGEGPQQPAVAPAGPRPARTRPAAPLVLVGFRLSRGAALAGLACWQLLSLSLVTLYALAARRPGAEPLVELG